MQHQHLHVWNKQENVWENATQHATQTTKAFGEVLHILMLDLAGLAKWISKCSGDGTLKNTWILNTLIKILNILNILNTLLKK